MLDRELDRRAAVALNRGDLSAVLALIDEDIAWEEGERSLMAGAHRGREGFAAFLRSWLDAFDDFRIELTEIVEHGEHLVAIGRQSGRGHASEVAVAIEVVHLWTISDGRAVGWRSYPSRKSALATFG